MGLLNQIKDMRSRYSSTVFGTWKVNYDVSEFDRVNSDGVNIVDLVPECRVFICGAEITKDVKSVTINASSNSGSTCNIELSNPRGRYEISKYDLMKKWREDKDILAAYDYDIFKRQDPSSYNNIISQTTEFLLGSGGGQSAKDVMKAVNYVSGLAFDPAPRVRGVTRMVFETKFFSGVAKRVGDLVFDYRDPIYVFFKGRFSPYWYFGFSGIVSSWDSEDAYGQGQTVRLRCEDPTVLWKRAKFTTRGAFYSSSRLESSILNSQRRITTNYYSDLRGAYNIADLVKIIAYSLDYGIFTNNCHISSPGRVNPGAPYADASNQAVYNRLRTRLHGGARIGTKFMTTGEAGGTRLPFLGGRKYNFGQIPISDIDYVGFSGELNSLKFSPYLHLYTQYNEVELPRFTGENLKPFYDLSVRYWESGHEMKRGFSPSSQSGTGWEDNLAFGVCGIHPALRYDFINNFSILEGVWRECYQEKDSIDDLVVSPIDKIRESIIGSPVEAPSSDSADTGRAKGLGSNLNLFRPRLFLVLPQKFANRQRNAGASTFTDMASLFGPEEATTIYDYLKTHVSDLEYSLFTSPMGDIFLEPEMYDFHPLDFSPKIESRSIVKKDVDVQYREISDEVRQATVARQDKAYMFDPNANHPFFFMEKDRMRCTQTFDPKSVYTSIKVSGSQTGTSGMLEIISQDMQNVVTSISGGGAGSQGNNPFVQGWYIADGFENLRRVSRLASDEMEEIRRDLEQRERRLRIIILVELSLNKKDETIINLARFAVAQLDGLFHNPTFVAGVEHEPALIRNFHKDVYLKDPSVMSNMNTAADKLLDLLPSFSNEGALAQTGTARRNQTVGSFIQLKNANKPPRAGITAEVNEIVGANDSTLVDYFDEIDKFDVTINSFYNSDEAVRTDLINLYYPAIIAVGGSNAASQILHDSIISSKQKIADRSSTAASRAMGQGVVTLRDIKELALAGLYNPRLDMVLRYGYNPFQPLYRPYVRQGEEAYRYAKTIFNKLYGKAHKISIDAIGRPEIFLNRPYYCEAKDAIGTLNQYSLSYSYGSNFNTNVSLEYVRKNSITYDYTLSEIDDLVGNKNNRYFAKEGKKYFMWNKVIQQSQAIAGRGVSNLIGGSNLASGVGAELAGGVASDILGSAMPIGGLYTSHDEIGHLEFDLRGFTKGVEDISIDRARDLGLTHRLEPTLTDLASRITIALEFFDETQAPVTGLEQNLEALATSKDALEQEDLEKERELESTTDEVLKRGIRRQLIEIQSEIEQIVSEQHTLVEHLTVYSNDRRSALETLYGISFITELGDVTSPGGYDHPSNVDAYVHESYEYVRSASGVTGDDAVRVSEARLNTSGLFVQLLHSHIAASPGTTADNFRVSKEPVDPGFGTIDKYYIARK